MVFLKKIIDVYILEIYLFIFIWTKYEKKLVKVGYLCMGQMMVWDNVVMFPFD